MLEREHIYLVEIPRTAAEHFKHSTIQDHGFIYEQPRTVTYTFLGSLPSPHGLAPMPREPTPVAEAG